MSNLNTAYHLAWENIVFQLTPIIMYLKLYHLQCVPDGGKPEILVSNENMCLGEEEEKKSFSFLGRTV